MKYFYAVEIRFYISFLATIYCYQETRLQLAVELIQGTIFDEKDAASFEKFSFFKKKIKQIFKMYRLSKFLILA